MSPTQRLMVSAGFVLGIASAAPASASDVIVPLGISTQSLYWVGEGVNSSGDGQVNSTFGTCVPAGGGNTTCNMTGSFAFGGGGNYDFQVTGPSPYLGVETTPTSSFYNVNFPNSSLEFTLNFNNGLTATYNNFNFTNSFVNADVICAGVSTCSGNLVGATPGSTLSGPVVWTLTVASVPLPAPQVAISQVASPTGPADQYNYKYNDLAGTGDIFIPIIDPSALVVSSLPSDVTIITSPAEIAADWPGAGNLIPFNELEFDDPAELLEIPEDGAYSLDVSFLDKNLPVDGPILADGTLISDPPVPGPSAIPEPSTWVMMLLGFAGIGFSTYRRASAAVASA